MNLSCPKTVSSHDPTEILIFPALQGPGPSGHPAAARPISGGTAFQFTLPTLFRRITFVSMPRITLEPLHPAQREAFRRMTPREKWALSQSLLHTAVGIRRVSLARSHPDWPPSKVERALADERKAAA